MAAGTVSPNTMQPAHSIDSGGISPTFIFGGGQAGFVLGRTSMLLATTVGTAGCGEHGFDLVCDQIIWLLLARYLTGTIHPAGSFWTLFGL